ncbi:uncharacterized protein LOC105837127 [Monomorium pharaonis]|uniref:uncharacterized protein LOC105837127 n=1 Tax=Monomorium pharaonis TaxID=307658 RepID=UPI00174649A0|nr:uncharacterized protein LOC105837127 [Monomorium pharaonis]
MCIVINDKLKGLLEQIKIDWKCARSQDEINIMQINTTNVKKATKMFLVYILVSLNIYMLINFMPQILDVFMPLNESRPWRHPIQIELFLDDERYFYTVRLLQYIGTTYTAVFLFANGTMFIINTQHASGMLAILGHRAEQLFNDKQKLFKSQFNWEKDYKNISIFVEDHRSTLQFVAIIQSCYSLKMFLEFFNLMFLLGTTLVQIIKFKQSERLRAIFYVCAQIIYMFMCSYMGQQLIDKGTQLFMKIYFSRWHSTVVWKQRMIIFIMLKCMRMITINMYNTFIISLQTVSGVSKKEINIKLNL